MTPPIVFGVAFHIDDQEEPLEVSHDELLALRTFGLVIWDFKLRHFRNAVDRKAEALAFIREFRAGGAQ
jgi:hypothetical protein